MILCVGVFDDINVENVYPSFGLTTVERVGFLVGEMGAKAAKRADVSGRQARRAVNPPQFDFPHAYRRDLSIVYEEDTM